MQAALVQHNATISRHPQTVLILSRQGLYYIPNALTEADEAAVLAGIDAAPASRWVGSGTASGRRTQNWGSQLCFIYVYHAPGISIQHGVPRSALLEPQMVTRTSLPASALGDKTAAAKRTRPVLQLRNCCQRKTLTSCAGCAPAGGLPGRWDVEEVAIFASVPISLSFGVR